jgi:hypothetical protein
MHMMTFGIGMRLLMIGSNLADLYVTFPLVQLAMQPFGESTLKAKFGFIGTLVLKTNSLE